MGNMILFMMLGFIFYICYNIRQSYLMGDKEKMWAQVASLAFSLCVTYYSYVKLTAQMYYYYY